MQEDGHASDEWRKDSVIIESVARIVAAYSQRNQLSKDELLYMIDVVHDRLIALRLAEALKSTRPAVPISDSVTPDHIVCLEDGKKFRMLKKHLMVCYGLTPEAYREKWGLPADYPMVAPNYTKKRKELARQSGLGRRKSSH